jgi:hypothetical protein
MEYGFMISEIETELKTIDDYQRICRALVLSALNGLHKIVVELPNHSDRNAVLNYLDRVETGLLSTNINVSELKTELKKAVILLNQNMMDS